MEKWESFICLRNDQNLRRKIKIYYYEYIWFIDKLWIWMKCDVSVWVSEWVSERYPQISLTHNKGNVRISMNKINKKKLISFIIIIN